MTDIEERQVVVFELGDEKYGTDINTVREIIRMPTVTQMPGTPEHVRGVINLRGRVIPVVDLRTRFRLAATELTPDTRVLVVDINGENIGVVVDAVTEVRRISSSSVEAPGATTTTEESFYIEGIAKQEEHLLILLDLERALMNQVPAQVGAQVAAAQATADSAAA
ncbi:MAG: chemotaxis protein CheW [Dehalococcoidia bacterium]